MFCWNTAFSSWLIANAPHRHHQTLIFFPVTLKDFSMYRLLLVVDICIMQCFVVLYVFLCVLCSSFDMKGLRIDICLRHFLETFRLSGEAPVISFILEHFADRYYVSITFISHWFLAFSPKAK